MQLWIWVVTGIVAGYLAGFLMKGRDYGLVGNLILGLVGSLVGGWVMAPTETDLARLHARFDELREKQWAELVEMQARQIELLERLVREPGAGRPAGDSAH